MEEQESIKDGTLNPAANRVGERSWIHFHVLLPFSGFSRKGAADVYSQSDQMTSS